jgi:hypothetical protein
MTYDRFWLEDHPFWSHEDAIATVRDEYPHAWADYWGISEPHAPEHLDPDLWEEARRLYSVAQRLVRAAGELSRMRLPEETRTLPKLLKMEAASEREARRELLESLRTQVAPEALESPEWRQIENLLRWGDGEAGNKERLFGTAVEIHTFGLWGSSPGELARRCLELLDFLVRVSGVRAREYLRRVSNCYIRSPRFSGIYAWSWSNWRYSPARNNGLGGPQRACWRTPHFLPPSTKCPYRTSTTAREAYNPGHRVWGGRSCGERWSMERKSGKQAVGRQYTGAEKAAVVADVAMLGLRGAGRLVGGEDPAGVGGIPVALLARCQRREVPVAGIMA